MFDSFIENLRNRWRSLLKSDDKDSTSKQKIAIIAVCILLAFLLWLAVNLNRSYTVNVNIPLVLGQVSSSKALAEKLPENVTVSLSGEGWDLMEIYRDPPSVYIEVSDEQVNLFEQVRRQLHATTKLRVQTVDPLYLRVELGEQVSKKVPVVAQVQVDFAEQYGFLDEPVLKPDSVTVIGARSVIQDVTYRLTDSLSLTNVNQDISLTIPLKEAGQLVVMSEEKIQFKAEVAQYTEGEVTVPIVLREGRSQRNVIFSPKEVTITFLAPVKEFPDLQGKKIFAAYVTYNQLMKDTTGFVSPQIIQLAENAHLKVQQVQPPQVAYFTVVSAGQ